MDRTATAQHLDLPILLTRLRLVRPSRGLAAETASLRAPECMVGPVTRTAKVLIVEAVAQRCRTKGDKESRRPAGPVAG